MAGRCEFDPKNIFKMEEFDKFYSKKPLLNEFREEPGLMAVNIVMLAGANCVGGIFLPLFAIGALCTRSDQYDKDPIIQLVNFDPQQESNMKPGEFRNYLGGSR